ncbi:MAG: hypothetical protein J7L95_00130, partial [Prolixibacteraceae bacterium]|nr:hypothetical protein [Prolixibacteraceae bacterium]
MVNPAFVHSDNKITIAFPGLAGVSVENSGNFKISDLIHHDNTGKMVYDLDHFTGLGKKSYLAKQQLEIPLFYLAVPVNRGMVSFYLKEKVSSSFQLPAKGLLLLQNGNNNEQLTRFYSGNLKIQGIGYNEAAFGFSKKTSKNFQVGIRGKLLFGQALIEPTNWNYAAETFNDGQQILISSDGNAKVSGLFNFQKNKNNQVVAVITGPIKNYLTIFSNPGVAFDYSFSFQIVINSLYARNRNDVGAI